MFESFFARFAQVIPRVKADDEELIDPQQVLRHEKPKETLPKKLNEKSGIKSKSSKNLENVIVSNDTKKPVPLVCKTDKDDKNGNGNGNGKGNSTGSGSGSGKGNGDGSGSGGDDDDTELVDPMDVLREKCREQQHAVHLAKKYEDCNARVLSKSQTAETCVEELFDLLHAIDHCVTEKLFSQLK